MKIKIDDYWKPQLRALGFFFSLPHQTSFLLYKCMFDEVNFTRRCFHDAWLSNSLFSQFYIVFFSLFFFFLYLIKPRFYCISACLMRSTSHGDVSQWRIQRGFGGGGSNEPPLEPKLFHFRGDYFIFMGNFRKNWSNCTDRTALS